MAKKRVIIICFSLDELLVSFMVPATVRQRAKHRAIDNKL
jgi:hypothetical protein